MKTRPNNGLFGIKVIRPVHLEFSCFWEPAAGEALNLMNFRNSPAGRARAGNIPNGHRMLVYVAKEMKFVAAAELRGSVDDGAALAALHATELRDVHPEWTVYRPIRFYARIALNHAPTAEDVATRCGYRFRSYGAGHQYLPAETYQRMFDAIQWEQRY